jgi:hypothetical protein
MSYNFATQEAIGKPIEFAFETLLTRAGIPFGRNPFNGTPDPRRAWYDHWLFTEDGLWVEEKANPAAKTTGNVAIEIDILDVSHAHEFLIAFPVETGWHGRMLSRLDLERLLTASKLTFTGRFLKYPRVSAGQFKNPCALVPVADLMGVGMPVDEYVKSLTKQAA